MSSVRLTIRAASRGAVALLLAILPAAAPQFPSSEPGLGESSTIGTPLAWSAFVHVGTPQDPQAGVFVTRLPGAWVRVHGEGLDLVPLDPDGEVATPVRLLATAPATGTDRQAMGLGPLDGVMHVLRSGDGSGDRTGLHRFSGVSLGGTTGMTVTRDGGGLRVAMARLSVGWSWAVEGTSAQPRMTDGVVAWETPAGTLRLSRLPTSTDATTAGWTIDGSGRVAPDTADGSEEVLFGVEWITLLGGDMADTASRLEQHPSGDLILAGRTSGGSFPVTPGAFDEVHDGGTGLGMDVFVARMSPDGTTLRWATYLGGTNEDEAYGLAVLDNGSIVVGGRTISADFPVTPGPLATYHGFGDAFVSILSEDGDQLFRSALIGGKQAESLDDLALDGGGRVWLAGGTASTDFPVTESAAQPGLGGSGDAFVACLDQELLAFHYATYWGGMAGFGGDGAEALAVDGMGRVVVTGSTNAPDFPLLYGGADGGFVGVADVFVTLFDANGQVLLSRLIGGTGSDIPRDVAFDEAGRIVVAGHTWPPGIPATPGLFDTQHVSSGEKGFVARLDDQSGELLGLTYIGGSTRDRIWALASAGSGTVAVVGDTLSTDFPVTAGAFQPTKGGFWDHFVARLSPDMRSLHYGTYLGGTKTEGGSDVGFVVDVTGSLLLSAYTSSPEFPTTPGVLQEEHDVGADAFLAKLTLLPTGVHRYGMATSGSLGAPYLAVTGMPEVGSGAFGVTGFRAPASSAGLLLVALASLDVPLAVKGIDLWVDPTRLLVLVPLPTDTLGYAQLRLAVPPVPALAGFTATVQGVWMDAASHPDLAASNALELTVQP